MKQLLSRLGLVFVLFYIIQACKSESTSTSDSDHATLEASISEMALVVSGKSRKIRIQNTADISAEDVSYTLSTDLPEGSSISPEDCGDVEPSESCELTITPGAVVSSPPGDANADPILIRIDGSNTNTLTVRVYFLDYGSVYQGGYLFSMDDDTSELQSISGKVVSLEHQAGPWQLGSNNGISWSSDENGVRHDDIPGVEETAATPADACNGKSDGACNTAEIVEYYSPPTTNPATDLELYIAGTCKAYRGANYNDWYAPSICEMVHDEAGAGTGCGTEANPAAQNIHSNLVDNGNIGDFSGAYWSSTEASAASPFNAWLYSVGDGRAYSDDKGNAIGLRCVRKLTIQ